MTKTLGVTDVVLRDAHQSLLATRMRIEDMLPIAGQLDQIGFWSLETWGGATFDACIRFLGEDPWERLRQLKKAMPKTRQQMLLRGQNLLGYRHYADDVVETFVERAAINGIDVFRIFDAMNDLRNLETAVRATIRVEKHAQGTIAYTVSPVHTLAMWVDMGKRLEDMGCHSVVIKDMAGLLKPYVAFELVGRLKEVCTVPIAMQCHATTGLSTATIVKAVEAGLDIVDTAISSMSMTYGHSPTESIVSIFEGGTHDTGLDLSALEQIASYFREVRKKYASFEGSLKGVDARILLAQVPGGMLTNMESQMKEQGALERMDEVLEEIPKVRKDLGYIPLVTPTSQIVGTQAVLNVIAGERYQIITKETSGVLKGEYGATAAPVSESLQLRVLQGEQPITCRPADLLEPEVERLTEELASLANERSLDLADEMIDDVLIYAIFDQVGLRFLENRNHPEAFEPPPKALKDSGAEAVTATGESDGAHDKPMAYHVKVNGRQYNVQVAVSGEITDIQPHQEGLVPATPPPAQTQTGKVISAPLTGSIHKLSIAVGQSVQEGQVILIMEAMKMETEVRAPHVGTISALHVKEGDSVQVGDPLCTL